MLLHIFHQILHAQANRSHHLHELYEKVTKVPGLVSLTDAVSDPRTVMIESGHAEIARLTVLRPNGLLYLARIAVLLLNEKLYRLILILFLLFKLFILPRDVILLVDLGYGSRCHRLQFLLFLT